MTPLYRLIEELERLDAGMTPGPFEVIDKSTYTCGRKDWSAYEVMGPERFDDNGNDYNFTHRTEKYGDAHGIARLRNVLPQLIEILKEAESGLDKIVGTKEYSLTREPWKAAANVTEPCSGDLERVLIQNRELNERITDLERENAELKANRSINSKSQMKRIATLDPVAAAEELERLRAEIFEVKRQADIDCAKLKAQLTAERERAGKLLDRADDLIDHAITGAMSDFDAEDWRHDYAEYRKGSEK